MGAKGNPCPGGLGSAPGLQEEGVGAASQLQSWEWDCLEMGAHKHPLRSNWGPLCSLAGRLFLILNSQGGRGKPGMSQPAFRDLIYSTGQRSVRDSPPGASSPPHTNAAHLGKWHRGREATQRRWLELCSARRSLHPSTLLLHAQGPFCEQGSSGRSPRGRRGHWRLCSQEAWGCLELWASGCCELRGRRLL